MKISQKQIKATAVRLLKISRNESGFVDAERVKNVLGELSRTFPPQVLRPLLKAFYAEIARELRFSEAKIEFAGTLSAGTAKTIAEYFSEIYKRAVVPVPVENPELLGGVRVQVGDDVYDASFAGALAKLQQSLSM